MRLAICLLALAVVPSIARPAPLLASFDTGLQGWTVSGTTPTSGSRRAACRAGTSTSTTSPPVT
jgi:hypothetical protein